jgi:hypothetical protein
MYCSICGADNQTPDAYCKRCGEWLPDIKARRGLAFGGETPQQTLFTGLFMSALSTLAALVSAIALYATYLGSSAESEQRPKIKETSATQTLRSPGLFLSLGRVPGMALCAVARSQAGQQSKRPGNLLRMLAASWRPD